MTHAINPHRKCLLVIEDDDAVYASLQQVLARQPFNHHRASSLASAREALQNLAPDIVLLDVILSDGDGLDLVPKISVAHPAARIVVMTGQREQSAAPPGIAGWLIKPFLVSELLAALETRPP